MQGQLVLASESPRRREFLVRAGLAFRVESSGVDEEQAAPAGGTPADVALQLAIVKARAVATRFPADVVLAADTVVGVGRELIGKPGDEADARRIITRLQGTTQEVVTGLAVRCDSRGVNLSRTVTSVVRMRSMAADEVDAYVQSGRWRGKAGGYGIQDADPIVELVRGSLTNVIGLPVDDVIEMLALAGISADG
ncbi:MAG: nucleoside triphosphate pyrophosphatase [Phycisphaerae bacterium]